MSALSQNPHRNFATLLCSRSSYEPADDVGALRSGYKAKASACLGRTVVRDRRVVPDADHLATWSVGQCVARLACRLIAVPMVKRLKVPGEEKVHGEEIEGSMKPSGGLHADHVIMLVVRSAATRLKEELRGFSRHLVRKGSCFAVQRHEDSGPGWHPGPHWQESRLAWAWCCSL